VKKRLAWTISHNHIDHKTLDFFFISQNFMHILHIYVNINDRCDQYHEMRMLYGKEKYNQLMLIDKEKKVSSPPLIFHGLL
jgi:metal-dependent hydrolase (beta-lactamase superfamily II)